MILNIESNMKPRPSIDGIFTFNVKNEYGAWIPIKITVGSWITLQPGGEGAHVQDAAEHGGATSFKGAYKAKVLKFRVHGDVPSVKEVLVQHAYMHRQLNVHDEVPQGNCNYLYPSRNKDWVDVTSITGVVWVVHADIGEAQQGDCPHDDLLQNGIFFYNALYIPRAKRLEPIPLPKFSDPEWPLPDMTTSEFFKFNMRRDFQSSMRPSIGSQSTHLQWLMPIHVMVDLFASIQFRRTPFFFIFHNIADEGFSSIMDDGWDEKHTAATDVIKCIVSKGSVIFKYHIARCTLYATFEYNRLRLQQDLQWREVDQALSFTTVTVECEMPHAQQKLVLEVGSTWSLFNIWNEVCMHLEAEVLPDFTFAILENSILKEKVSRTDEENIEAASLVCLLTLRIVPELQSMQLPMLGTRSASGMSAV